MDDYLERVSRGEHPSIQEYAERYPELADVVGTILPTLEVMRTLEGMEAAAKYAGLETPCCSSPSANVRESSPMTLNGNMNSVGRM